MVILFCLMRLCAFGMNPPTESLSERIHQLHDHLLETGKTTQQLSESDLASLPVGITKSVGGYEYLVIIDSARFTPKGAFFDAYISLQFKTNGQRIAFAARNVAFHRGGLSASNEVRLALVNEATLPLGSKTKLTLPAQGNENYVAIDCNGFKAVNLQGKISFSREMLIPEDEEGNALPGHVETDFRVNSSDWNALMLSVSLPTFRIPNLQGINFKAEEITLDMSDIANPAGIKFPQQYEHQYGTNVKLWEGFFIRRAKIGLFKELSEEGNRRYINAENLILDKEGITGGIGVNKLFGREEGSLNGWPFSVDSLGIILVKNKLSGGGFKGEMNIPLLSRDTPLKYTAFVTQEAGETEYTFAVQPGKNLNASVLAAKVDLAPSSTIIISKKEGRLIPEAILHGALSIHTDIGVELKQLGFTDLHIVSEKPYIRNGYWSFANGNTQKVANYPISIESITFQHNDQDLRLNVGVFLGLMNKNDKGFSAQSIVSVSGEIVEKEPEMQEENTLGVSRQEWKHKETRVSDIEVDVDMDAFKFKGRLSLYKKHEVYGQGFRGEIDASFKAGPTVKAIAQFGRVNDYRYWYADALMHFGKTGASPGFSVYGFGGGAYYQMSLDRTTLAAGDFYTIQGEHDKTTIGATRSGASYVPDPSVKLGLKATVVIGTSPSPRPFNADATFEMAFNQHMGLKYIRFRGEGYFLTGLDERNGNPPMYADVNINYDFDNDELNALLDLYVDAYGVMKGINANNMAGRAIMHFGQEKWYIWLGSPSQRIGVNVFGLAEASAYLMVGDEVENLPVPLEGVQVTSKNLQEVLHELQNNMASTAAHAASGKGFVFGASFHAAIGKDDPGAIFYGFFKAGAGFDIMLQDMGNVSCSGKSGPIGINGWYASGQAWAYLQGAVGINVNLKFIKGKFEAFRFLAAIVMQAQLPNPTWLQGTAFGEFNILNGLVKGDCSFQVTIGEQCTFENEAPIAMEVIADMQPSRSSKEVDVFTTPQVAFNLPVEEAFEMLTAEEQYKSYRVKLNYLKVTKQGTEVTGVLKWNEDKTVVAFKSDKILPPKTELKAEVSISWQEQVNNHWTDLEATESREVSFTTGEAPNYIPEHIVEYSYPIRNQYTFLQDEYGTGYMKLSYDMDYLFEPTDEQRRNYEYVARFKTSNSSAYIDKKLTYSESTITFAVPDKLDNETIYNLSFLKKPVTTSQVDENVLRVEKEVTLAQATNVTTAERNIEGTLVIVETETLFTYGFRTSRFNTFSAKVDAMYGQKTTSGIVHDILIYQVGTLLTMPEVFDEAELSGTHGQAPLIKMYADTQNHWFSQYMHPLLYEHYPVHPQVKIGWRNPEAAGVPPIYSVVPELRATAPMLTQAQMTSGNALSISGDIKLHYQMPTYTYKDHRHLRLKAINKYAGVHSSRIPVGAKLLMHDTYQNFMDGTYKVKLEYRLPGTQRLSSTKTINIQW